MPIEVKVLHHGDFLYYMRLKITHILLPHLTTYYSNRIKVIKYFMNKARLLFEKDPYTLEKIRTKCSLDRLLNLELKKINKN
jgi:hypothetical protein